MNCISLKNAFWVYFCFVFAGVAFGERGSVYINQGVNGGYPSKSWTPTKAFLKLYDFKLSKSGYPMIYSGHSAAGNHSYQAAVNNAENTLCATPSGWKHDEPSTVISQVPIFTVTGDGDFGVYNRNLVTQSNEMGNRESLAWHRGHGHHFSDPDLLFMFWVESIRLRYPPGTDTLMNTPRENGWLGDMSRDSWDSHIPYIAPFDEYKGSEDYAYLPTRYFAFCWRGFVVGKNRTFTSPIVLTPKKTGTWAGYTEMNEGEEMDFTISYSKGVPAKMNLYDGDGLVESMPGTQIGLYRVTYKAKAGLRGLVAVAYDKYNTPMATSRLTMVIVNGEVQYPEVDNSPLENINPSVSLYSIQPKDPVHLRKGFKGFKGFRRLNGQRAVPESQTGLPGILSPSGLK